MTSDLGRKPVDFSPIREFHSLLFMVSLWALPIWWLALQWWPGPSGSV